MKLRSQKPCRKITKQKSRALYLRKKRQKKLKKFQSQSKNLSQKLPLKSRKMISS